MEERLEKVLAEINEEMLVYEGVSLLGDGIIDSLDVIDIITGLEEEFDIDIDAVYATEENFKTKETILRLVEKLTD